MRFMHIYRCNLMKIGADMDDQKAENLLNLALDATEQEREKSESLNVGYNKVDKEWELIIRYSGDLSEITDLFPQIRVSELTAGYAIFTVPESLIEPLSGFSQIEYIEKPKRLYFAINHGKSVSGINPLQTGNNALTGRGVIVAVIDSGIDYYHGDFRNADGTTRILELWDQTKDEVYTREQINEALASGGRENAYRIVPSIDLSGHGTAVTGIAAGNGRESDGQYRGIAYESDLLIVKLGAPMPDSFPRTTELMRALDYVAERALYYNKPVAINLSFGNTYGPHDGTGLLETYINEIANRGRTVIITGTGNEGSQGGHTSGNLTTGVMSEIEMSVAPYETGFGVQLWKSYADEVDITIISPGGIVIGPISRRLGSQRLNFGRTTILLYYGQPSPYSQDQEIYMDFIPNNDYVESGIWTFRLTPHSIKAGQYDFWLPTSNILNPDTKFLQPTPETTLTIPSTAARVISVGAYNDFYMTYADFSGRGYTRVDRLVKPDIVAPGVNIIAPKAGGGYEAVTGTSFAAPFVTGSAALLMEWGIVKGNDPFLYGEKIKAYLIRGARPLSSESVYPNPQLGYGALFLEGSLP